MDISENGTAFKQLRVGCFLDEILATSYLKPLKNQLMYPSLSSVAQSETATTSFCLAYETGIELPNQWEIIRNDEVFLLGVTLLDYQRFIGFNGESWNNFQTEDDIPENRQMLSKNVPNLNCQNTELATIDCNVSDYTISLDLEGDILWQKGNTAILKVNNSLKLLKGLEF